MTEQSFSLALIVLSIITQLVQSSFNYSWCTYYDYYQFPKNYGDMLTNEYYLDLNSQQKFGIGFWMSYRPLMGGNQIINPEAVQSSNLKQLFVFSFDSQDTDVYSILFYIDISLDSYQITHNMLLLTDGGIKLVSEQMDVKTYEGDWIFVYCFSDPRQQSIDLIYYSTTLNNYFIVTVQEYLLLSPSMRSVTGRYRNALNEKNDILNLQVFPGIIQPVILNFGDSFFDDDFYQFSSDCWPLNYCQEWPKILIEHNTSISEIVKIDGIDIFRSSYTLQGWTKINPLISKSSLSTVLLRISTYQHNSDNNQIGDRLLYIMYYQSNIDNQQNGFTLQTYSYTFPWRPSEYKTDQSDIIYALDQEYKDLIIQWHYFQYEYGTFTNNGQPIYTVYFTSIDTIRQYTWNKQINHFTTNNLYFNIGGDEYYPNTFQGQLSDWIFNLLCDDLEQVEFKPACHYSCEKCKGITQNDCISCNKKSNRVYSESQNTCKCKYGLIDKPLVVKCLQINEYSSVFKLEEQEIIIKGEGYYNSDESNIICEVGYFKYNNTCVQCPYQPQQNSIKCADCYFYPDMFSVLLNCTFKIESQDEFSVLFNMQLSQLEVELYTITQHNQKYVLQLKKGHYTDVLCKDGYYLSNNNNCQECPANCSECDNDVSCNTCTDKHTLDQIGNCIYCENCSIQVVYVIKAGFDRAYLWECGNGQYITEDRQCFDCGKFCSSCSENVCYYCQDPYFLTLDYFNCAECPIQNCKYCFQYEYSKEYGIKTSLDINFISKIYLSDVKTACALCDSGFTFSFLTFQCEPSNLIDCQSSIITDSGLQICLKSETRLDAIQQPICADINCLQCINNYSSFIQQFCVVCKDGYYSSIHTGKCLKCPSNCLSCVEYNEIYNDQWKINIRSFYQFFINSKKDHSFEDFQMSDQLAINCINCSKNFQLDQDFTCQKICSDDCLDCESYKNFNGIYEAEQRYKCNKCKVDTFNQQRSVNPLQINQCLSCPDYCPTCYPRSTAEIGLLNPFFNVSSKYLKYSHICPYFEDNSQQRTPNFIPNFLVPVVCQGSGICQKQSQMSFYLYCDISTQSSTINKIKDPIIKQKHIYFNNIQRYDVLNKFLTDEMIEFMNQVRTTQITQNFELIKKQTDDECNVFSNLNFTNNWKKSVFTLLKTNIIIYKSPTQSPQLIQIILNTGLQIINYDKITFDGIQFVTFPENFGRLKYLIANNSFINQYSPITLIFRNCELISQSWNLYKIFTYTSIRLEHLRIEQFIIQNILIQNSSIFDLEPNQEYINTSQIINQLAITNSSFRNTNIFYYRAEQFSLRQKMRFTNVTIINCNFSQSYFINSSYFFDYNIGELELENFYLENLILLNSSILFQILNTRALSVKNFTIKNVKFEDSSSLFVCNIISVVDMKIINSIINSGYFIHVYEKQVKKNYYQNTKDIYFSRVNFSNNIYSNSNSFIYIFQQNGVTKDEVTQINVTCIQLMLDDNNFINNILGIQQFSFLSHKSPLIYIECTICSFNNINILRGIGLPEISIINSQQLQINNFHLESKKEYFQRYLHSNVECVKQFIYLDIPFTLYIWSYQNVILDNITIQNTIVADYPLIIFFGKSQTESIQSEDIKITNSLFQNNLLLIIDTNRQSSIFFVQTQQDLNMILKNTDFNNNFLNAYYQNQFAHSSTTLLIQAQEGLINLDSTKFEANTITNSSDSILYIKTKSLFITNCKFSASNILTEKIFVRNLITLNQQNILFSNIQLAFPILSQGGHGYIEVSYSEIKNTTLQNSLARNGGGFYIVTFNNGLILIQNCSFYNTSTLLNGYQISSGGLFYIDSTQSNLNLTISNCSINQSYSRALGGAIFIDPSRSNNYLNFNKLTIYSVFSIQNCFLSFSPNKQITVASSILMNNNVFSNSETEFQKYASQITGLSQQNSEQFQMKNPIIYILYSKVIIKNCVFFNTHLANIIEIEQATQIDLQQIDIFNSTIFQSPIIKLSIRFNGTILMRKIRIQNLVEYKIELINTCSLYNTDYKKLICPSTYSVISEKPILQQLEQQNQLQCNLNQLYSVSQKQAFSIIQIIDLDESNSLTIEDISIFFVYCLKCDYGLFSVQSFNILHLQMDNFQFKNNICGILGCLSIIKSVGNIDLLKSTTQYQTSEAQDVIFNTKLIASIFMNNTANYGGACFFSEIDILISSTQFSGNKATNSGGSIYYISSNTTLSIINSSIVNNSAEIGGGIYLQNQQLEENQLLNLYVQENKGNQQADNLYELPRQLFLSLDVVNREKNIELIQNSSTVIQLIKINPYTPFNSKQITDVLILPSGRGISQYKYFNPETNSYNHLNMSFRLQVTNVFGEKIKNLQNTECSISANSLNTTLDQFGTINNQSNKQFISYSTIIFNNQSYDYNLDDLIIYFDPYQDENLQLQLAFSCNSILIPYYNSTSYKPDSLIKNYILLLNVKTFACQLGEYFNQTSGGCVLCDIFQSQYSVTINATACQYKDETSIEQIEPATIQLRPYYWRAYYYSEVIEKCYNLLANCQGGWLPGNPSCAIGHLGALCEQCDLYNIKGEGSFSQNQSYQCSSCESSAGNILNVILVISWALISVLITVSSTIKMIDDFVFQLKLKPLGFHTVFKAAQTSILLKVFTNYLQIVSSITSFQLALPIGITLAVRGVGNPVGSMAFSLDCYLKSFTNIPMIYFRIIWGFVMAGMYIFLFFFFHVAMNLFKKQQLNITFITTTLIYIYIYLSPNQVSDLSFLISYRNASNQQWIAANVAYLYNTEEHKNWQIYFLTPTFFIIGIFLPFFFWYILYYHRAKLNSTRIRKVWGYLYNEYKLSTYYWETIKIVQKELIIIILIYYEDYVAIKACLIFFLLHLYGKLTSNFKPYLTENLNEIDSFSTSICKISIVLAWSIYQAQSLSKIEIVWPFYIVLAAINFFFVVEMITKLTFAYFDKLYEQIDKLKAVVFLSIPSDMKNNKICQRLLKNTTERKIIVRLRFQQIRKYLINQARYIINFKKQNNMGLQSTEINQPYMVRENKKLFTMLSASPKFKFCATEIF